MTDSIKISYPKNWHTLEWPFQDDVRNRCSQLTPGGHQIPDAFRILKVPSSLPDLIVSLGDAVREVPVGKRIQYIQALKAGYEYIIARINGVWYMIHLLDLINEHLYTDEELGTDGYIYSVGEFRKNNMRFDSEKRYCIKYSGPNSVYWKSRDRMLLQDPAHSKYFTRLLYAQKGLEQDSLSPEIPTE